MGICKEETEPFASKIKEFVDNHEIEVETIKICPLAPWLLSSPHTDTSISKLINKQNPPCTIKAVSLHTQAKYDQCLAAYMDASRSTEGRVTSAFCVPEMGVEVAKRITDKLTVNTADLVAIKLALEFFAKQVKNQKAYIQRLAELYHIDREQPVKD